MLDQMCKYEMDPTGIVDDTERTRLCPQTDRRTRWNQYTPFQLRWSWGYDKFDNLIPFEMVRSEQSVIQVAELLQKPVVGADLSAFSDRPGCLLKR